MVEKSDKDTKINKRFAASLKCWFESTGLTQVLAAERIGLTQSTFSNIIGGRKGVSFSQIESISEKLDKDPAEMLIEGRKILEGSNPKDGEKSLCTVEGQSSFDGQPMGGKDPAGPIDEIIKLLKQVEADREKAMTSMEDELDKTRSQLSKALEENIELKRVLGQMTGLSVEEIEERKEAGEEAIRELERILEEARLADERDRP